MEICPVMVKLYDKTDGPMGRRALFVCKTKKKNNNNVFNSVAETGFYLLFIFVRCKILLLFQAFFGLVTYFWFCS